MNYLSIILVLLAFVSCNQKKTESISMPVNDELGSRIKMASERLVFGKEPEITEDFLLAGVTLDPKFGVRFAEFSGDQAGRYLSTFSRIKVAGTSIDLDVLAKKIISNQKADGRFGNADLVFDPTKLTGNHMALLWGNGRLLTGLMDYYAVSKNPEALQSAIKLGKFLTDIAQSCTRPEVIEKFKTMGAMGFICFTQITDGLVKLYEHTSDQKYVELAGSIYKLLPEFGNQHSHGYLNTVLGVVGLYNATKDSSHLSFAEHIYQQVVNSDNYLITGGVPEFFGEEGFADGFRDEGCSEADFVMLSLELWKATGKMDYLDKTEYCLLNEMMYNQYCSGDFGSHPIDKKFGFTLSHSQGRAWWCCNYHGLQAMLAARDIIVTNQNGVKQVNLYSHTHYKDADVAFTLGKVSKDEAKYKLVIDSCGDSEQVIALRIPTWESTTTITVNGKVSLEKPIDGYVHIKQAWKKGDEITIDLIYKLQLVTYDRKTIPIAEMPEKLTQAALQYGPYLLSVDDVYSLPFMSEISKGNVIYLNSKELSDAKIVKAAAPETSNLREAYLQFDYKHEGYYQIGQVAMRPVSEVTHGQLPNVQLWFNFEKK
jgi:DUF1680 family protein